MLFRSPAGRWLGHGLAWLAKPTAPSRWSLRWATHGLTLAVWLLTGSAFVSVAAPILTGRNLFELFAVYHSGSLASIVLWLPGGYGQRELAHSLMLGPLGTAWLDVAGATALFVALLRLHNLMVGGLLWLWPSTSAPSQVGHSGARCDA